MSVAVKQTCEMVSRLRAEDRPWLEIQDELEKAVLMRIQERLHYQRVSSRFVEEIENHDVRETLYVLQTSLVSLEKLDFANLV
jgi:predicted Fe-S protein YdhL (DUF1289 family)